MIRILLLILTLLISGSAYGLTPLTLGGGADLGGGPTPDTCTGYTGNYCEDFNVTETPTVWGGSGNFDYAGGSVIEGAQSVEIAVGEYVRYDGDYAANNYYWVFQWELSANPDTSEDFIKINDPFNVALAKVNMHSSDYLRAICGTNIDFYIYIWDGSSWSLEANCTSGSTGNGSTTITTGSTWKIKLRCVDNSGSDIDEIEFDNDQSAVTFYYDVFKDDSSDITQP